MDIQHCSAARWALPLLITVGLAGTAAPEVFGQEAPRLRGAAIAVHGIYGHSVEYGANDLGGIGVEVDYAPVAFLAAYVAGTAILVDADGNGWRTKEAGLDGRLKLNRVLVLHAALGVGNRTSSSFSDYSFAAFGAGVDAFVSSRLALQLRIDRIEPRSTTAPGYLRNQFGLVLHLGH